MFNWIQLKYDKTFIIKKTTEIKTYKFIVWGHVIRCHVESLYSPVKCIFFHRTDLNTL